MRSYWDEDLAILSAENVSFSVETAGLGSRLAALSVDFMLQMLIVLFASLGFWGFTYYIWPIEKMPLWLLSSLTGLAWIGSFLVYFGYFFIFEWLWDGQTPGKRQMGLRVMMANGLPLTMWAALTRNTVRMLDLLPLCYGAGALVALCNPHTQRAGDIVAGTIVARERRREKQRKPLTINEAVDLFLNAATTVPGTAPAPASLEEAELKVEIQGRVDPEAAALAMKLTREDYELARDYLQRRDTLPHEARERLLRSLVQRFAAKLGEPPTTDVLTWLQETVAALARAYGR